MLLVTEGFVLNSIILVILGYYFKLLIAQHYPHVPKITVSWFSYPAIAPVITICYLAIRFKHIPKIFTDKKKVISTIIVGAIVLCVFNSLGLFIVGKYNGNAQAILHTSSFYFPLNIFLYILWIPFIEEVLFRGYFLEILRGSWGVTYSICFSSLLFVLSHHWWFLVFSDIHYLLQVFAIFLASLLFSLSYIRAGLIAAILMHTIGNCYVLYINTTI
jgi:membrane protease YdiL (CAAX protease family)